MSGLDAAQLRAVADLVRVGLSVVRLVEPEDPETWVIAFSNPASSEASGGDVEQHIGQRFLEAFPAIRATPFVGWYQQVHREGREIEIPEITYGDALVPEAAFRVWLAPLPGDAVLGQYVNVTEQRRAEGQLRRVNEQLEREVERRTLELDRSRRYLTEIAYASAHDLLTPVRQVLGLVDLLRREQPPEGSTATLDQIAEAGARMQRLLDGLMHYAGRLPMAPTREVVEVGPMIDAAVEATRPWPEGARIDVHVVPARLRVVGEEVTEAVRQLLDNALRFVEPGAVAEVVVDVGVDGADAVIEVRDRGIGIDVRRVGDVIEPFHVIDDGRGTAGAGLGLALCRATAEMHDGTLTIDARHDGGLVVRMVLADAVVVTDEDS